MKQNWISDLLLIIFITFDKNDNLIINVYKLYN